ncbi:MAG: hypothetical protein JWN41_964, partial [Thermoleophilia bacterium]|nr:hypothetical protein [Thermoleophilia bacterium]
MGGFGGITGLAVSAAVVGTVGAAATTFSSNAQDRYDKQLAKDNAGKKWGEQRPRGDGADATIDGRVRIGLALAAGGSAVTALGAALLHAPGVATVSFGAAAGLLGAALLGGTGSPVKSLASIGNAISSDIHLHHLPTSRSVRAQLPKHAAKAQATPEAKPSAKELLDAPLREMPGVADKAAAKGYAANALAEIDWSKPDIVLWVPATATHSLHVNWSRGAEKQFGDRASVSMVNYP